MGRGREGRGECFVVPIRRFLSLMYSESVSKRSPANTMQGFDPRVQLTDYQWGEQEI